MSGGMPPARRRPRRGKGEWLQRKQHRMDVPRVWVREGSQTGTTAPHKTQNGQRSCDTYSPFKTALHRGCDFRCSMTITQTAHRRMSGPRKRREGLTWAFNDVVSLPQVAAQDARRTNAWACAGRDCEMRTGGTLWKCGIHVIHVWRVRETNAAQVCGTPPDWGVQPYGHRHRVREKGQEEASERVSGRGRYASEIPGVAGFWGGVGVEVPPPILRGGWGFKKKKRGFCCPKRCREGCRISVVWGGGY